MTNSILNNLVEINKANATAAAYLEAGKIANNQLVKILKPKTPMVVRGYLDSPVAKLVVANLMNMAVTQFKPDNTQLNQLSQAMICQAYQDVLGQIDIESFLEDFLSSNEIKKSLKKLDVPTEE